MTNTDRLYLENYLPKVREVYSKSKSWETVVSSEFFFIDEDICLEALIDHVEKIYKTKVKDGKHLAELTGLTDKSFKATEEKYNGSEPGLDEVVVRSKFSKYYRALENILFEGGKYKDLLEVDPTRYGLTEPWEGCLANDKYKTILLVIYLDYEPGNLINSPDLRSIANDLEAPYSVIMDSYKQCRSKL